MYFSFYLSLFNLSFVFKILFLVYIKIIILNILILPQYYYFSNFTIIKLLSLHY